jgi:hypothetical protein
MKLCPECTRSGVQTGVEFYRTTELNLCSFHYWLGNAKGRGWTLEEFTARSEAFKFRTSLPSPADRERLELDYVRA